MGDESIEESVARSFTDERLAEDLKRMALDIRYFSPVERAARLREAAKRLIDH